MMPLASHNASVSGVTSQKSHKASHLIILRNKMVPLTVLSVSHDADTNASGII